MSDHNDHKVTRTTTCDLTLVGAEPSRVANLITHLQLCFGASESEAAQCVRDVRAGMAVGIFEDLSQDEADSRTAAFALVGGLVERRTFVHPDPCDVVLIRVGPNKLRVLQTICELQGGDLQLAMMRLEALPTTLCGGLHRKRAEQVHRELESAGADAHLSASSLDNP